MLFGGGPTRNLSADCYAAVQHGIEDRSDAESSSRMVLLNVDHMVPHLSQAFHAGKILRLGNAQPAFQCYITRVGPVTCL